MVIGISILFSVLFVIFVLAIFPMKVEKKPLFWIAGISAILVLFAVYSAYVLAWWYGILVFAGLLLALTILIGKKIEWIKPIHRTVDEKKHKPFELEYKGAGRGQSVFDEEVQQMVGRDLTASPLRKDPLNTDFHEEEDTIIASIEVEQEVVIEEPTNHKSEDPIVIEQNEIVVDDFAQLIDHRFDFPIELSIEEQPFAQDVTDETIPTVEVEELSDEWLRNRLDALYGEGVPTTQDETDRTFPPSMTDIENDEGIMEQQTDESEDGIEYEDLSQLYYNGQRGENHGTTK